MACNKTILVVDDEVHIQRILALKLKNAGYGVLVARNGAEGLQLIQTRRPDAVISDINMPELDGKSLCEMTDPLKQARPFLTIIITARISSEEHDWIQKMRDTVFMEKPFSPNRIVETLKAYLGPDIHG